MKIILAYNPFGDIKVKALNRFLKRSLSSSSIASLASGSAEEKDAFAKATAFFERNNFKTHFKQVVDDEGKYSKYDSIYQGALMDIARNQKSFDDFFGKKFDLGKVGSDGSYPEFKNDCGTTNLVGWLNDALGLLVNKSFKNVCDRNQDIRKEVNGIVENFKNGAIKIEEFYNSVGKVFNKCGESVKVEKSKAEAFASMKKVMSKDGYDCYEVRKWEDLNAVASHTEWCVAQNGNSGRNYFDGERGYIYPNYDKDGKPTHYLSYKKNAYFVFCKGTKPVALFNISTRNGVCQFKGINDQRIEFNRPTYATVIKMGDELRSMLGQENNYNDDFNVFFNFNEDKVPTVPSADVSDHVAVELPEIYFDSEDMQDTLIKRLDDAEDDCWDILGQHVDWLKKNEKLRNYIENETDDEYSRIWWSIYRHVNIAEAIPSVEKKLVDRMKKRREYDVFRENRDFIWRHREFFSLIAKAMTENDNAWEIVYAIPELVNESPEIRKVFEEDKTHQMNMLIRNPSLVKERDELGSMIEQKMLGSKSLSDDVWQVIARQPDVIEWNERNLEHFREVWNSCPYPSFHLFWARPETIAEFPFLKEDLIESLSKDADWHFLMRCGVLFDLIPQIYDMWKKKMDGGFEGGWQICYNDKEFFKEFFKKHPDAKDMFIKTLEKGKAYDCIAANANILEDDEICNAFMTNHADKNNEYDYDEYCELMDTFCQWCPKIEALKYVLSEGIVDYKENIIFNQVVNIDELFDLCKGFYNDTDDVFQSFFIKFHGIDRQEEFWKLVMDSQYLFDALKNFFSIFPDWVLDRLSKSDDEDIRWIVSKKRHDRKASRIARRISLEDMIALKITGIEGK